MKTDMQQNIAAGEPKKRGRKPGSKNKVKSKRNGTKGTHNAVFQALEKEVMTLMDAIQKAQMLAAKELEKIESRNKKEIEKVRDKANLSIKLWKNRAKDYRAKLMGAGTGIKRSVGRPAKLATKPAGKRGRPAKSDGRKGGGRKKAGELTKKDIILNYIRTLTGPITSKELILNLFLQSGETDQKRYAQGIYTTLTQIYKTGELRNNGGNIELKK